MKRIVVDLDLTIAGPKSTSYSDCVPDAELVARLVEYSERGFEIIVFTARNMQTYRGSVGKIVANTVPQIIDWLNHHQVPYDELIVGKPWCGHEGFYIDDRAVRPSEFKTLSKPEIDRLLDLDPNVFDRTDLED